MPPALAYGPQLNTVSATMNSTILEYRLSAADLRGQVAVLVSAASALAIAQFAVLTAKE